MPGLHDDRRGHVKSFRHAAHIHAHVALPAILAIHLHDDLLAAARGNAHGALVRQRGGKIRLRRPHDEPVGKALAAPAARIGHAHEVAALRRRGEEQARILAELPLAVVVVHVVEREDGQAIRHDLRADRLRLDHITRLIEPVPRGARIEVSAPHAAARVVDHVGIRPAREAEDLHHFAVEIHVVVQLHLHELPEPDARRARIRAAQGEPRILRRLQAASAAPARLSRRALRSSYPPANRASPRAFRSRVAAPAPRRSCRDRCPPRPVVLDKKPAIHRCGNGQRLRVIGRVVRLLLERLGHRAGQRRAYSRGCGRHPCRAAASPRHPRRPSPSSYRS